MTIEKIEKIQLLLREQQLDGGCLLIIMRMIILHEVL